MKQYVFHLSLLFLGLSFPYFFFAKINKSIHTSIFSSPHVSHPEVNRIKATVLHFAFPLSVHIFRKRLDVSHPRNLRRLPLLLTALLCEYSTVYATSRLGIGF